MRRFSLIVLLCLLLPSLALAEKRVALVIGNSAYQHTPKLANPKNDAADMAVALKKLGFQVLDGFDLDKPSFDRRVRDFATALQGAQVGVFFFAGHGLQVAGHNYLVPIDAQLSTGSALDFEMVRLDLVHRTMEREAQTNILFLDACRDNPLARNLARAMGTRSTEIGRGLAVVESGIGTLISFSTQPGNVALDGTGRNSPFAGSLVKHVSSSSDDLSAVLIAVRNDVMKETQRKQVPWEHSALTGRFYFKPPSSSVADQEPGKAPSQGPRANSEIVARLQRTLKNSGCYHGRVDGIWSEDGRQALALFFRENGREPENLDATIENILQVEGGVSAGCPSLEAIRPKTAAGGCAPKVGAQVLSEPNRGRPHPDWPGSELGTSWTLVDAQIVANATGRYVYGKLYSPRGGYQKWVYGLAEQWDCR